MSSRIVAEGVAAPLLPTSAPPPDRRLPKTRLRRRSLLPSSVDLPCFLIVIGLILCSISVGSLVTVLGRGASPLRRPSIGGWDYARLPAAIPTTGFETFLPDQVVDGDDDKKGAESESANVGDARLAKALAITEATGGRYLVRDWPLWLGWNNIRYIFEASAHQAQMLNRTLVIPSHVVGRACEHSFEVCADWAPMINRGKAVGKAEWDNLPVDKQWAWLLPVELFLDFDRLQATQNVITTADFLRLRGRDPDDADVGERTDGQFDRERYLGASADGPGYYRIEPAAYDTNVSRVDRLPIDLRLPPFKSLDLSSAPSSRTGEMNQTVPETRPLDCAVREWFHESKERARWWWDVRREFAKPDESEADFRRRMADVGVLPLETFAGIAGMEMTQSVVEPDLEASLSEDLRGWWDDFHGLPHEVLHLAGETHLGRKPGQMRFTTTRARDDYSFGVLDSFRPPPFLTSIADRMTTRMLNITGGRTFLSAHARRGDFATTGWVMESTPEAHIARVKERLGRGRSTLEEIVAEASYEPFDIPPHSPARNVSALPLPLPNDHFYLATDERNATALALFRIEGAVFAGDLLTAADRRELAGSWALVFTDVVGVLEQEVLARAGWFYGHAMSSFVGGVVNRRAALGQDRRADLVD